MQRGVVKINVIEELRRMGGDQSVLLNKLVHSAMSSRAEDLKEKGVEAQVDFLRKVGYSDHQIVSSVRGSN